MRALVIGVASLSATTLHAAPPAAAPADSAFKVFEADLGQTWIDVSAYPAEQQQKYALFTQKCSKCHTLARPINSTLQVDQWEAYVSRMSRKPGSGISPKDAETILSFLLFDAQRRTRKSGVDPELVPFLGVSRELCGVDRFPACLRDIRAQDGSLRVKVEGDPRLDLSKVLANDAAQKLVKWSRRAPHQGELVLAEATLAGDPAKDAAAPPPGAAAKEAATEAIGAEKDPRERVELLLDWLDEEMVRELRPGTADVDRVLEDRKGDATEFTRAFVAMARAIGIPARPRVGFVARRTAFYLHTWAEVWLGGWVEVDPYLGQLPADLTHIRLITTDASNAGGPAKIPGLEKMQMRVDTPEDSTAVSVAKES